MKNEICAYADEIISAYNNYLDTTEKYTLAVVNIYCKMSNREEAVKFIVHSIVNFPSYTEVLAKVIKESETILNSLPFDNEYSKEEANKHFKDFVRGTKDKLEECKQVSIDLFMEMYKDSLFKIMKSFNGMDEDKKRKVFYLMYKYSNNGIDLYDSANIFKEIDELIYKCMSIKDKGDI